MTVITPPAARSLALLTIVALAIFPALAPLAGASGQALPEVRHDRKAGTDYVLSGGSVTREPGFARIGGSGGFVEYQHSVSANGVPPDSFYVSFESWGGSGSCRFQVFVAFGGAVFDSGLRGCTQSGYLWGANLPAGGVYTVRLTCQGSCFVDIAESKTTSLWPGLDVFVQRVYSGGDVSEQRVGVPPGTCVTLYYQTTLSHSTVVEIDWGDGTPLDVRPAAAASSQQAMEACHPYLPQTIPYQACFRLRETNGLGRVTTLDCEDLPFLLPSL